MTLTIDIIAIYVVPLYIIVHLFYFNKSFYYIPSYIHITYYGAS